MRPDPYLDLPSVPAFQVSSSVVAEGATMPVAQRSGVTMYDPDAPTPSGFWHWRVVDLPSDITSMPAGAGEGDDAPSAGGHITNDAGLRRYVGAAPVPPPPVHRFTSS